ncbi:MAG: ATP-binding protein [Lachnospiraceae bacterium]|nr:ATP-binding protein [Lachnospiraceae bacterium]
MRSKIQRSMSLVLCITLLTSYILFTVRVYQQDVQIMKSEVKQETQYLQSILNMNWNLNTKKESIEIAAGFTGKDRITLVNADGTALYDSQEDVISMKNQRYRVEIKEALTNGNGSYTQTAGTLDEKVYYYAIRLNDETIIRVSRPVESISSTIKNLLPYMGILTVIMLIFAIILARWQTRRLIKPINELDLEHPLNNNVYKELTPLLNSIDLKNKQKDITEQMRKEFSANVSHELKTPLTSISGYAEIMKNKLVKEEDIPLFAERIYNEASRLIELIEDIIKLSKLDEENVEVEKEEVDLYVLAREICSRLAPQAEKRNVHIAVSGEPVLYSGIRRILDEMIYNICENAIKYNRSGGLVKIWVGNTLQGKKVIVTDTGIGIPEDQKDRIFERFYRVDKSHSKETGGTGLGLSIVKHGAMLHHATIKVTSELNKGTKIEITF